MEQNRVVGSLSTSDVNSREQAQVAPSTTRPGEEEHGRRESCLVAASVLCREDRSRSVREGTRGAGAREPGGWAPALRLVFSVFVSPPAAHSVPGRVSVHTQHSGHEGAAHHQGDPPKPGG